MRASGLVRILNRIESGIEAKSSWVVMLSRHCCVSGESARSLLVRYNIRQWDSIVASSDTASWNRDSGSSIGTEAICCSQRSRPFTIGGTCSSELADRMPKEKQRIPKNQIRSQPTDQCRGNDTNQSHFPVVAGGFKP